MSGVNPSSVVGSNNPQTFTVSGSNFVSGARTQVAWGNNGFSWVYTTNNPTFVNSSTLTVSIVTQTTPDTWRIRVVNPDDQISANYATFTVTGSTPPPSVSGVSPSSVVGSNNPQVFTVSGSNFVSGARTQVAWGNNGFTWVYTTNNPAFVNSSTLTVSIVTQTTPDTWRIRVVNPDGQISANYATFTVTASATPPPSVSGVSPSSVVGSNNPQTFTVSGSNFVSGARTQVAWGGNGFSWVYTTNNPTFINSGTLTVSIVTQTTPDTWRIRVVNPDGQISANYATFTVTAAATPPPSVTGVSPSSVVGSNNPQTFTVSGSNFVSGARTQVAWGGNGFSWVYTTNNPTFVNSSTLTVSIVTQTTPDTWRIRVVNPDGQISASYATFTVMGPLPTPTPSPTPTNLCNLIIASGSVTFNPPSVNVGESFNMGFRVSNLVGGFDTNDGSPSH